MRGYRRGIPTRSITVSFSLFEFVAESGLGTDERFVTLGQHRDHALPATLCALSPQYEPPDRHGRTGDGQSAEGLREQASHGVDVVIFQFDAEQVSEFVDRHPRTHPIAAAIQLLEVGDLAIVL